MAGDVAEVDRLVAVRPAGERRHELGERGLVHVDRAHARARLGECPRDRGADPAAGAGDDDPLALEAGSDAPGHSGFLRPIRSYASAGIASVRL